VATTFQTRGAGGSESRPESTTPYIGLLRSLGSAGSPENVNNENFCNIVANGTLAFRATVVPVFLVVFTIGNVPLDRHFGDISHVE
jgi:hypothetical protein